VTNVRTEIWFATVVDVAAFAKHWTFDLTATWPPTVILEFARMRMVVVKELCKNIVLRLVKAPPTVILFCTDTGPTDDTVDKKEALTVDRLDWTA